MCSVDTSDKNVVNECMCRLLSYTKWRTLLHHQQQKKQQQQIKRMVVNLETLWSKMDAWNNEVTWWYFMQFLKIIGKMSTSVWQGCHCVAQKDHYIISMLYKLLSGSHFIATVKVTVTALKKKKIWSSQRLSYSCKLFHTVLQAKGMTIITFNIHNYNHENP